MRIASNIILLCLLTFSFFSRAQTGGRSVFKFLDLPNSARIAAMGGSVISTKDGDLNMAILNPSLLSPEMDNKLALSYVGYFAGVAYGYTTYAKNFDKIGTFNAGIQYMDYGVFTAADNTGIATGQFRAADYAFTLGYARPVDPDSMFTVGTNLKYIYSKLEQYTSTGIAVDLAGTYYNKEHEITVVAMMRNMGSQFKTYRDGNYEPLPFDIDLGFSKKPTHVPFRFNITVQRLQKWDLTYVDYNNPTPTKDPLTGQVITENKYKVFGDKLMRHFVLGGEFILGKNFNIQIGYNYLRRQELKVETTSNGIVGFSGGFGIRIYKFNLSYGYASYHLEGGSHHFTLATNISDFYSHK